MNNVNKIFYKVPILSRRTLLPPSIALKKVTSKTGKGVYASSDTLFRGAIFGRDSLEVGEDLVSIKPRLVSQILLTLGSLQGLRSSDISEEEHGRILHEYRTSIVDGKSLDDISRHIFNVLSKKWGGNDKEMTYYGSIDATPLFIRLAEQYVNVKGESILDYAIKRRDGSIAPFRQTVVLAIDWLSEKLASSSSGLLEYRSRNPHGIENQVWKDSQEFYVHKNGKLANHNQPIASIEVQGLAYDALMSGSKLIPDRKEELIKRAHELRDKTINLLWQPSFDYFALGLDHESDGKVRIIETVTANPAALLDTRFFEDLPYKDQKVYITGLVKNITGADFLTDAGVRSRSLKEKDLIKFWDYHGSFTSWPKETYDIARGLRRQGFPLLAEELENRILNVVRKSKNYPEFVYVDFRGRVMAGPPDPKTHGELSLVVDSTNRPESVQAWTVSAVIAILNNRSIVSSLSPSKHRKTINHQHNWQRELENQVLTHIPRVPMLRNGKALEARYPDYKYYLNHEYSTEVSNFLHKDVARYNKQ